MVFVKICAQSYEKTRYSTQKMHKNQEEKVTVKIIFRHALFTPEQ
jgi:hypothetical protein